MRKIVAAEYLTLDGVMEAPSWTAPYWSDALAELQQNLMLDSDALLLGRVTYEEFAAVWPEMEGEEGAEQMNSMPKFVASSTLKTPKWNASLLQGDVAEAVQQLKQQEGGNLLIYGSGELVQTLMKHSLIDEYRLMVFPLTLGTGKKLFAEGSKAKFKLTDATTTDTGVAVLTYQPGSSGRYLRVRKQPKG